MPTIVRLERCVLYIYAKDHNPPHFHVRTRTDDAVIEIETLELVEGSVDRPALREALDWARENKEEILEKWNEFNP